jgi:hypothetical protein
MGLFPDIGRHEQRVIKLRTVSDLPGPLCQDRMPRSSVKMENQSRPSATPLMSRKASIDSIDLRNSAFIIALESAKAHFETDALKVRS